MRFDVTGKVSLAHIYDQPDPRAYFRVLRPLDYGVPQQAKPYFAKIITEYRESRHVAVPKVLDIGCSYGINAALLKYDATMDELYARYRGEERAGESREALLARDRELARSRQPPQAIRFVGLDTSGSALSYALEAGFLDNVVHADLEEHEPTPRQRAQLSGTDLMISTGCVGYVTERTLTRVVRAQGSRRPWMAHFVLRMFPFDSVERTLASLGYRTVRVDEVFRQRRFASAQEQALVLDSMSAAGVDPRGLEAEGWLYAQLYLSRPYDIRYQRPESRTELKTSQDASGNATFAQEDSLPRVPLPTLEASCERFLAWCTPLLTADERSATEAEVAAFLRPGGPGRVLHAALEEYDAADGVHSWLDTFWPYRYLGRRDRIALNANFFFLFQDSDQAQVERAAGLVAGALNYKRQLDQGLIPPVVQRGAPQSMVQNKFLFSTTRIPGAQQDTVRAPYTKEWPGPSEARHIVVFFRGGMFRLDVLGPDGVPHSLDDIEAGLRAVMQAGADPADTDTSVGHLTTMARAEWAAARESLLACHPRNADALDGVENALFCVVLEDFAPADVQDACDQLLYGDRGNRWFDKAVSFVVFADGRAGINVEHCELDGTTILTFTDALLNTPAEGQSRQSGARSQGLPALEPIVFELDDSLRAQVRSASDAFAAYGENTATSTLSFADFGSSTAKVLGVSPDAFVQAAYQLAHQRAKGHLGATYESIATRQYRHGRTEAMRVVTTEMVAFVSAMEDPAADADARRAAFRAATEAHVARAKACQAGQVPEQHLWELELIQRRRGAELGVTEQPALYRTPGWLTMRDDYLSTSSAPSVNIQYFGFGSTSSQCIGVAYVLLPERFNLYLSTPMAVAAQMRTFADRLREAMDELRELLASERPED